MKGIFTFFFLILAFSSRADHIIGGDIYYDDLGGGNYKFYITIYRDCNAEGAWFDDPLKLAVYNNNTLIQNVDVFFQAISHCQLILTIRVLLLQLTFVCKELFMKRP